MNMEHLLEKLQIRSKTCVSYPPNADQVVPLQGHRVPVGPQPPLTHAPPVHQQVWPGLSRTIKTLTTMSRESSSQPLGMAGGSSPSRRRVWSPKWGVLTHNQDPIIYQVWKFISFRIVIRTFSLPERKQEYCLFF